VSQEGYSAFFSGNSAVKALREILTAEIAEHSRRTQRKSEIHQSGAT
jgi:hypothetical protein